MSDNGIWMVSLPAEQPDGTWRAGVFNIMLGQDWNCTHHHLEEQQALECAMGMYDILIGRPQSDDA